MPVIYRKSKEFVQEIFQICLNAGFNENVEITNAAFGSALSKAGKSSKDYGYPQLKDLIPELPFFRAHVENRGGMPHIILKFDPHWKETKDQENGSSSDKPIRQDIEVQKRNGLTIISKGNCVTVRPASASESTDRSTAGEIHSKRYVPRNKRRRVDRLRDVAFIHPEKLCNLEKMVLGGEHWYFGDEPYVDRNGYKRYPILECYLDYTYVKLVRENKIKRGTLDGVECFAFNTGLVDETYDPIIALCLRNDHANSEIFPWKLRFFAVMGKEKEGKTLMRCIDGLPERADYFSKDPTSIYLDPHLDICRSDVHILIDNCRRLPVDFIRKHIDASQTTIDGITLEEAYSNPNSLEYESYFEALKQVMNEPSKLRRMKDDFNAAQELAVKKAQWNYKTAVPTYFPTLDRMSLLLPLALVDETKVDVALVLSKEKAGYQGQTILTMNQAYIDSRLITRPDSDWLTTENKDSSSAEDDEEGEFLDEDLE